MAVSGLLMAVTSAIGVDRTSWVNRVERRSANIELRIRLDILIIRSQMPLVWEACGVLKTHLHSLELRYDYTDFWLISFRASWSSNSLCVPTKLVRQSEWVYSTCPLIAMNRRRAFINQMSILSISSMWIALVEKQVKRSAHRLLLACLLLVRRAVTSHGPKTSSPT